MILADVMDEIAELLEQIAGINKAFAWPPETLTPPAGYASYPQSIDFDQSYGRGLDKFTGLTFGVVSGKVTDRTARDRVSRWSAGAGPESVKQLFEQHRWQSCQDFTVTSCAFEIETIADINYLTAVFTADVFGKGA